MQNRRTVLGILLSVAWLATAVLLLLMETDKTRAMTPNEWGDFLAGVFAPLAFLWLVLGYMQQGDELRLSTEALRLQAEELRNAVDQQRELVAVSRQQVESEREALEFERTLRQDLSLPRFSVSEAGGSFSGTGRSTYNFRLSNAGHAATELVVTVALADGSRLHLLDAPLFDKGAQRQFTIERESALEQDGHTLTLDFKDGLGRKLREEFKFGRASVDARALLTFRRAEA